MTVTTDDPSGPLPSRRETLDYSAERAVTSVRVVYDEEQVFDGSSFVGAYTGSEHTGNDLAITRRGGWQKPFTIYVDEQRVTLQPVAVSTSYSAAAYDLVQVNASGAGTKTITLPATALDGDVLAVQKTGTAASVVLSGAIDGGSSLTLLAASSPDKVVLRYESSATEWQVIAHEVPATPVTTLWTTLYEKDLRTLSTDAARAGYYADETIDGQPWWFHVNDNARFINGTGLVLIGSQPPSSGNNYAGTFAGLRVSEMSGYDAAKHVAIQFRCAGAPTASMQLGTRIHTGGSGFGSPAIGATTFRTHPAVSNQVVRFNSSNYGLDYQRSVVVEGGIPDLSTWVFSAQATPWVSSGSTNHDTKFRTHSFQRQVTAPTLPAMEDMQPFGVSNDTGTGEGAAYRMGFWVAGPGPGGGTTGTAAVTHVRVLQRAVASL